MKKQDKLSSYKIIIAVYLLIAIFAPLIANEKPLYISVNGKSYFPAFSREAYIELNGEVQLMNSVDWKNLQAGTKIFAPVRYSPGKSDLINSYVSPFDVQKAVLNGQSKELSFGERHFLGTGKLGNDTFAEIIHGTRLSVLVGTFSMIIAVFIGVLLGGLAGYFGDYSVSVSRLKIIVSALLVIPAWFYGFQMRKEILNLSFRESYLCGTWQLFLSLIIFTVLIILPFALLPQRSGSRKIYLPVDNIISRLIEIFVALPRLILILTVAAFSKPSAGTVIVLIGLTSWTEIARVVRSQILYLKKQNYIEAAKSTGMTSYRLIVMHILPGVRDQVLSVAVFGVASAIMIETGLSFLGLGIPAGTPTWGQVMFEARQHYTAWWLVLFSGMAISGLLYSLYLFSQKQLIEKGDQ